MHSNQLLPSSQARFKVGGWNAAHSAANASMKRWREAGGNLSGSPSQTEPSCTPRRLNKSVGGSCAPGRIACSVTVVQAQVQYEFMAKPRSERSATRPMPNPSLERTSTGMAPRTAQYHVASRGATPVAAAQLKR